MDFPCLLMSSLTLFLIHFNLSHLAPFSSPSPRLKLHHPLRALLVQHAMPALLAADRIPSGQTDFAVALAAQVLRQRALRGVDGRRAGGEAGEGVGVGNGRSAALLLGGEGVGLALRLRLRLRMGGHGFGWMMGYAVM